MLIFAKAAINRLNITRTYCSSGPAANIGIYLK